ncbi:MAG TPA: ABC transporter permease [Bryobacteraceae bacterium]|jgi:putative ABC transport system permease protein
MAFQEIRHTYRMLAKNPGFTAIAALSLALGIGANSAIFSLADALLLRPLAVRDPGSVVTLTTNTPDNPYGGVSYPNYRDIRAAAQSFDGMVAYKFGTWGVATSAKDVAQMRMGMFVSDNFFDVLGVAPKLGRSFRPDEGQVPGRDAVLVLGHDYWRDQFASDPSIVGKTLRLNGIDFTVIGIAPEEFKGMDQYIRPALFVPVMMKQRLDGAKESPLEKRGDHDFSIKARLKSGASLSTARAEMTTIWTNLQRQYLNENRGRNATVMTEIESRYQVDPYDAILVTFLMGLVMLVLIIACANVANLLLARAQSRTREIAIRLAIGSSRLRLLRQLLLESLTLAMIGGAFGLIFAYAGIRFLHRIQVPTDLPIVIDPVLDGRVLLFSFVAALLSALFFGLAPALQSLKAELVPALKAADRGSTARGRTIGRNVLVVGQVALSMALLVATGVLIDAVRKTLSLDPGFRTDHLLIMEFDTSLVRYTDDQTRDFYRNLKQRAEALNGVKSVTLTSYVPLSPNGNGKNVIPEGYQFPKGRDSVSVADSVVDDHYFDTMRTLIVRGRGFTADDRLGSRRVAVINAEFAKNYWPGQDPIGKRFRLNDSKGPWVEIVGLTKTNKYFFFAEPATEYMYLPFAQEPTPSLSLIVETYGDPSAIATPLREVVRSIDANQPIFNVRTFAHLYEQRATSVAMTLTQLVAAMGLVGLTLALVGLYGLIAYSVSRRTQEIGIRMAIGANRADVLRMVLRQGLSLVITGVLVGSIISFGVVRMLSIGLAGIGAPSPMSYALVPFALLLITTAACYIPARRAAQIDPIRALRYE